MTERTIMNNKVLSILLVIFVAMSLIGIINLSSKTTKAEIFGANIRVDDTNLETSWQRYPSVTIGGSGEIYVVWEDNRSGNWDIYFSKSTNGGISFDSNVRVDDTGTDTSWQMSPSLAIVSSGEIYVVWSDTRNGAGLDIYFSKSTNGGISFQPNVRVDDTGTGASHQSHASIAVGASGEIYVVWQDQRNGEYNIYFAKSTDGGLSFDANVRVDNTGVGVGWQEDPSIAVDSIGNIYVAFTDFRNGNPDIYFAKSTDGGISFDTNVRVDDTGIGTIGQYRPSIAVDNTGNISIVWRDDRNETGIADIYFAKSTDGGLSFGTNVRVDDSGDAITSFQLRPSIAIDSDDNIYVTWEDTRNDNSDIYFSKSTDGGVSFEPNIRVDDTGTDTSDQEFPVIAVDSNRNVSIVWNDRRNDNDDIYYSKGIEPNNPPNCEISSPSNDDIVSGTLSITGTASDTDSTVQSVEVKIDSGSWNTAIGTISWNYSLDTTTLSEGNHTVYARSYDGINYSQEASVTVIVRNIGGDGNGKTAFEQLWFWVIIVVIIVAVVIVAIVGLMRRKGKTPMEFLPPPFPPSTQ